CPPSALTNVVLRLPPAGCASADVCSPDIIKQPLNIMARPTTNDQRPTTNDQRRALLISVRRSSFVVRRIRRSSFVVRRLTIGLRPAISVERRLVGHQRDPQ